MLFKVEHQVLSLSKQEKGQYQQKHYADPWFYIVYNKILLTGFNPQKIYIYALKHSLSWLIQLIVFVWEFSINK